MYVTIQLLFGGGKSLGDEIHVSKVFFVVESYNLRQKKVLYMEKNY